MSEDNTVFEVEKILEMYLKASPEIQESIMQFLYAANDENNSLEDAIMMVTNETVRNEMLQQMLLRAEG